MWIKIIRDTTRLRRGQELQLMPQTNCSIRIMEDVNGPIWTQDSTVMTAAVPNDWLKCCSLSTKGAYGGGGLHQAMPHHTHDGVGVEAVKDFEAECGAFSNV